MVMSVVYLIEAAGSVSHARLRHDLNFRAIGLAQIAGAAATMGIAVIALQAGSGFLALIYCRLGASMVSTAIAISCSAWRPRLTTSLASLRPLLGYAVNVVTTKLLSVLNVKATDLIIGLLGGPALLGAYQLASRLLNFVLQTILSPVQTVCLSLFAKQTTREELQSSLQHALAMLALVVFPIAMGLAVVAPEVVGIIFGPNWGELATPMAVLMLACLPASINYLLYPVLVKLDRTDLAVRFVSMLTVTGIVLTLVTAPFGLLAVAAAFTTRTVVGCLLTLRILRRELGLNIGALLGAVAIPATGTAAVLVTTLALREQVQFLPEFQRLMVLALAGATSYLVVLALLWRKSPFAQALLPAKGKA
jgi:O-antigen/teichoic acid export membrane protein